MVKDKTLLTIGIVAFALAVLSLVATVGNFGITGNQVDDSDEGNASIQVSENVQINFTANNNTVDWGSGNPTPGTDGANLSTDGTYNNAEGFDNASSLVIENEGNVNATLNLTSDSDASQFIGGGTGFPNPEFKWKVSDNESGSCTSPRPTSYESVNVSGDDKICNPLLFDDSQDTVKIDLEVFIPQDSPPEEKTATITAEAVADN